MQYDNYYCYYYHALDHRKYAGIAQHNIIQYNYIVINFNATLALCLFLHPKLGRVDNYPDVQNLLQHVNNMLLYNTTHYVSMLY